MSVRIGNAILDQGDGRDDLERRAGRVAFRDRAVEHRFPRVGFQRRVGVAHFAPVAGSQRVRVEGRGGVEGEDRAGLGVQCHNGTLAVTERGGCRLLHGGAQCQLDAAALALFARQEVAQALPEQSLRLAVENVRFSFLDAGCPVADCRKVACGRYVEGTLVVDARVAIGVLFEFRGGDRRFFHDDGSAVDFRGVAGRAHVTRVCVERGRGNELRVCYRQAQHGEHDQDDDEDLANLCVHALLVHPQCRRNTGVPRGLRGRRAAGSV